MDKIRPMNGGDGRFSYAKNSTVQRKASEDAHKFIKEAIEKVDFVSFLPCNAIKIADLGCSTGPNTFITVQNIIDCLEHKFYIKPSQSNKINISECAINIPRFQVFFNDIAANDFNQLFASLPQERNYFAAGVPGSFHGPLFPKDSLHFVNSSCAVHWLSKVPEDVIDKTSSASNKGRVYYSNSTEEVARAYEEQFGKDIDTFLKFRAREIVHGGLMALTLCGRSNGTPHTETYPSKAIEKLESTLLDMAKEGKVNCEQINSFNIPVYYASPEEVESAVKRSECFTIVSAEIIPHQTPHPKVMSLLLRAALEWTMKEHFDEEILDELFGTVLPQRLEGLSSEVMSGSIESIFIFFLLKCVKSN